METDKSLIKTVSDTNGAVVVTFPRREYNAFERNSMGEYIPPPRRKPLTSLALPQPGPADYIPSSIDAVKTKAPEYSILDRPRSPNSKKGPSPNEFDTSQNMSWKCKYLKIKGKHWPHSLMEPSGGDAPVYHIKNKNTGTEGPKYSIGFKYSKGMHPGHFGPKLVSYNEKVCQTPGPGYLPSKKALGDGSWAPEYSLAKKIEKKLSVMPGPADYKIVEPSGGPAYTMVSRSKYDTIDKSIPGPNAYDIRTHLAKKKCVSNLSRAERKTKESDGHPPPNMYYLHRYSDFHSHHQRGITMKYRRFEPKSENLPGPMEYNVQFYDDITGFNLGKKTKHFGYNIDDDDNNLEKPGPADYNTVDVSCTKQRNPVYSIGRVQKPPSVSYHVGPTDYNIDFKPVLKREPAYSMAKTRSISHETPGPGPGCYLPNILDNSTKVVLCGEKGKTNQGVSSTPAPNAYYPKPEKKEGIKLKSRWSPYVYSGLALNPQPAKIQ